MFIVVCALCFGEVENVEKEGKEILVGYSFCSFCGMYTHHKISPMVDDGITCLSCGTSYIVDDVTGVKVKERMVKSYEENL